MKRITLIAAGLLALGSTTAARADVGASAGASVDVGTDTTTTTTTDTTRKTAPSTTVTTPGANVTVPGGSTTTIDSPSATTTTTAPAGSTTTIETPTTSPAAPSTTIEPMTPPTVTGEAPTTNVEINTPAPVVKENTVVIPAPAPAPVQPVQPVVYDNRYRHVRSRIGAGVMVGGGVQDFSRDNARSMTDTGGFWNARLMLGTRQFIGFEAAYVGSAAGINALGLDNDALLVSNGAEGALRLNIPIVRQASMIEPFAFAGAGWSRYSIARSSTNTSSVASQDDVLAVPYGAGLAVGAGAFMADARFTYRSTFYNDMLSSTGGGQLDSWSVGGQLGFEF